MCALFALRRCKIPEAGVTEMRRLLQTGDFSSASMYEQQDFQYDFAVSHNVHAFLHFSDNVVHTSEQGEPSNLAFPYQSRPR